VRLLIIKTYKKYIFKLITLIFIKASLFLNACSHTHKNELTVVESVDIEKYTGLWYEIKRLPAWFQRDCYSNVTAYYELRADGNLTVVNECLKSNNKLKRAKGKAWLVDKKTNAKLKVSFFWPIRGDYWIIDLDKDKYQYAVVGHPNRKYLWILSREKELDKKILDEILIRIKNKDYKLDNLISTKHY